MEAQTNQALAQVESVQELSQRAIQDAEQLQEGLTSAISTSQAAKQIATSTQQEAAQLEAVSVWKCFKVFYTASEYSGCLMREYGDLLN